MNSIRTSRAVGFIALLALVATPGISAAATYAYVNAEGIVLTVEASDPTTAINTAPNRHMHSGVMLIDSESDRDLVGDSVNR